MTQPPNPIRLIALDLDGTLLRSDFSIGPRTRKALHDAHAKGIETVLASGRMTPAMERTADALGLDLFLVSYNGAVACGRMEHGRQRFFHRPLEADIARDLYAFAQQHGLQVNYYLDDVIHSEDGPHLRPWIEIYCQRTGSPYRFVKSLKDFLHRQPTKLLMVMDPARREEFAKHWKERLGARAVVVKTEAEYLEFLAPGADKGEAVGFVAAQLGVQPGEIMAMGDGDNDVPMLKRAGWPVAPANAGALAKAAAKAITQNDHDHDAVAEAVEKWVLKSSD
jgi:Cof subfamily protein (haloacid dehalogenase superfamily)